MSFKITTILFCLSISTAISQKDSAILSNGNTMDKMEILKDSTSQIDSPISPRNYFSEIDLSYFKINNSNKSVLKYIQPKPTNSKHYFFGILCILAATVVYIKYQNQKEFDEIIKSVIGTSNFYEKEISVNKFFLFLNYLVTSIILLFFVVKEEWISNKITDYYLITIIATTFCVIALTRYLLFNFLGNIFDIKEIFLNYQRSNDYINYMTGLILLPILFSEIYSHGKISHILLYIGLFIVLINILYKIIKNILVHSQLMVYNILHFIIYFCAVEIFPYLILNKFFREQIF